MRAEGNQRNETVLLKHRYGRWGFLDLVGDKLEKKLDLTHKSIDLNEARVWRTGMNAAGLLLFVPWLWLFFPWNKTKLSEERTAHGSAAHFLLVYLLNCVLFFFLILKWNELKLYTYPPLLKCISFPLPKALSSLPFRDLTFLSL